MDIAADQAYTNAKVIVARSYARYFATPDPDLTAQDDDGHGTGTAMAAAGITSFAPLTTITGLAPEAWLGIYKVFGTPGLNDSAPESAVINAIDDAVNDGMDVINLSLGSTEAGLAAQDPEVAAIESASAAGVIVTVSAGNSGPNPATVGTPAIAPSAIAVGASANDREFAAFVTFSGGTSFQARAGSNSLQLPAVSGRLVDITKFDATSLGCSPFPANSLSGAIALISRGTCFFVDKLTNAQAAGAVGAVVYDNVPNEDLITMAAGGVALPANFVSQQDGAMLKSLTAGAPQCNLQFAAPQFVDPHALAVFSAAGPTPDITIKPDIVAVGTNFYTAAETILSSGDLYDPTGFTLSQGTSFSAPLVAGAAALIKQARPGPDRPAIPVAPDQLGRPRVLLPGIERAHPTGRRRIAERLRRAECFGRRVAGFAEPRFRRRIAGCDTHPRHLERRLHRRYLPDFGEPADSGRTGSHALPHFCQPGRWRLDLDLPPVQPRGTGRRSVRRLRHHPGGEVDGRRHRAFLVRRALLHSRFRNSAR